jgi:type I restriction enzyme M protein
LTTTTGAPPITPSDELPEEIAAQLKNTREQRHVVGPIVKYLRDIGWSLNQIVFGKSEWRVPKRPSELTKRQKGQSFEGFPVDIAVFDDETHVRDPHHLVFLIECKQPNEQAGVAQLEAYFVGEPHCRLGIWANTADVSAPAAFIYRKADGSMLLKRRNLLDVPRPGEQITPEAQRIHFNDLIKPTENTFRRTIEDLLNKIVIADNNVTRREDQLDQLCNLLLLKLESDKQAKSDPSQPVFFRPQATAHTTANAIRNRFESFVDLYPETFVTEQDKRIRLTDTTVAACVDALSELRLIDLGVSTVSVAFQVLRSEALKQGEGQYFTPQQVIEAGVKLIRLKWEDIVLDPACGTGGFLVESILEIQRTHPNISPGELSRWAQTHIYGIEKDAIGLKLAKAIMQIAGDGSAHCMRGDSVRTHLWARDFPYLISTYSNGRFSVILTNPPFGEELKVSAEDARLSQLEIARGPDGNYRALEIGLVFLQRAYDFLRVGGRVGIVLPETYFFSSNYRWLFDWLEPRLRPLVVANIPMDAFQGFCRAKTNFYVFEKIA